MAEDVRMGQTHRMTAADSELLAGDMALLFETAETLGTPLARLTDLNTGTATTPGAAINGKKVQATVSGLTVGHVYHLRLTATGSGGNTRSGIIRIECVE